jgi:hypothetical protein
MSRPMDHDIVEVRALPGHRLWLRFRDGHTGEVDVARICRLDGVLAPLEDDAFFRTVRIREETGTVSWPNDVDLDSDVLYAAALRKGA